MANVQGDMSQFYRQYLLKQQESRSLGSIEPVQGIVEKAITEHPEIVESIIMESIQENEPKATSKQTDESDSATGELDESSIIEEAAPVVKKNKYEVYYHRNDEKSIEQARLRYLERKGAFIRQYLVEHVK
ncbi:hypothetical protein RF11_00021 [Thelohanellus kitauei]|uniref:Uncharacterized protein n=1 Tax=Thelohanellus kitauei TaxID=669202 RepID=A0A0C2NJ40_THEKT|nr:hypothetical protein RF11_00021 [Thelohanellus kitauei]